MSVVLEHGRKSLTRRARRFAVWAGEVRAYWRESCRARDFMDVMRIRLSQSRIGPWVTPHPIVVDVDLVSLGPGVRLRSHTTDISVLGEFVRGHGIYPSPPSRAETVIDLGANIGLAYRWLRSRYPAARFVCVEPDPGNLELLRVNVRAVGGRCKIVPACVGACARRVRLATTDGEWGFRMVEVEDPGDGNVEVLTMDEILECAGIDRVSVLKCDIEGAEGELFADCRSWIDRVDFMVVECHTDVMTAEALLETIGRNGARVDRLSVERSPSCGYEVAALRRSGLAAR